MHSANRSMDAVDCRQVLRGLSFGIGSVLVLCCLSSTAAVVLSSLANFVQAIFIDLCNTCYIFLSHRDTALVVRRHQRLDDIYQYNVVHIPMRQYHCRYTGLRACCSIRHVCIP